MFRRIFLTALIAGALAGAFVWSIQLVTTTPLILQAEVYEGGGEVIGHSHGETEAAPHSHDEPWMPEDGIERYGYTLLSSLLMGVGFGFILTAVIAMRGIEIDTRQGVLWGLGGFAALYAMPALGLPPELPGLMAGDLADRQLWWAATAIATAISLGLIVFGRTTLVRLAGVVIMAIPHVVGAPHPAEFSQGVPPELVAQFAVSSLISVGLFWIVLGGLVGYFFERFEDA